MDDFGEDGRGPGVSVSVPEILHQFIDLEGDVLGEETHDVVHVDEGIVGAQVEPLWLKQEPFSSHVLSVPQVMARSHGQKNISTNPEVIDVLAENLISPTIDKRKAFDLRPEEGEAVGLEDIVGQVLSSC